MVPLFLVNTFPAADADAADVDVFWTLDEARADTTVERMLSLAGPRYITESAYQTLPELPAGAWVVRKLSVGLDSEPGELAAA